MKNVFTFRAWVKIIPIIFFLHPPFSESKSLRWISPEEKDSIKEAALAKDSMLCFKKKLKRVQFSCVKRVAIESSNEKHCLILETLIDRAACLGEYAVKKNKPKVCDKYFVKSWSPYQICLGRLRKESAKKDKK